MRFELSSRWFTIGTLLLIMVVQIAIIHPELKITRFDQNDNVLHWMLIQDMAKASNPFDFWSPEIAFGQPIARLYQPGAHLLVVVIWNLFGRLIPLMTVFIWIRFLSVALLPISMFFCARFLGLFRNECLGAAAVSWLLSGDSWGLDFGSYAWAGHGLFPQAVATHLLLLTIGTGWWVLRGETPKGARWCWLVPAVSAVCCGWTNLLYGYVAALTLVIIAALPGWSLKARLSRLVKIAAFGAVFAAPKLLAYWQDRSLMWALEAKYTTGREWMTDGLGASSILKQLVVGEYIDHGRLPVLTILAFTGIIVCLMRRKHIQSVFLLVGLLFWIQVSFGRAFWGPLIALVGVTKMFQIHRLCGPVEVFLVLLAGVGIARLFSLIQEKSRAAAVVAVLVLLEPCLQDRVTRMEFNSSAGYLNLQANEAYQKPVERVLDIVRARGGRAYAGSVARGTPPGWGSQTAIGYVPMFATLTANQIPNIGFYYIGFLGANNQIFDFNDMSLQDYVDKNVKTVVSFPTWVPPPFLTLEEKVGEFYVYAAPGTGYFEGSLREWDSAGEYGAVIRRQAFGPVVLRAPFHSGWHATVDNKPAPVRMASNGFMKLDIPAGEHSVLVRYR